MRLRLRFPSNFINGHYFMSSHKITPTAKAYLGLSCETLELLAIKFEEDDFNNMEKENEIYNTLKDLERIPKKYWYGDQNKYTYLVVKLLGPSLKYIFHECCKKKFSLGTILNISLQMISILQQIHQKGVILRYIKPGNIVTGLKENKNKIYFIDFEYAKKYIKNGKHIENIKARYVRGNKKYISANAHKGNKTSRRDDIESLGYNIIYYMKGGKLPWDKADDMDELESIKMKISLDELCKGLPEEIKLFIKYAKEMEFYQEPDYEYLKGLLLKIAQKNNIDANNVELDWENNEHYNLFVNCLFDGHGVNLEAKNFEITKSIDDKNVFDKKIKNDNNNEKIFLKVVLLIYFFIEYINHFGIL